MVPPHTTYVEPFGGGATLLFAKEPAKVEVYNDKDKLLVNFFKILRSWPDEFMRQIKLIPYSRREFEFALNADSFPSHLDRALYFFVLCHQSMSGMLKSWSYGITYDEVGKWRRTPQVIDRMRDVQVECLDALDCIKRYDTPETFFYVDPPYPHETRSDHRYRVEFNHHEDLLTLLHKAQGMVLLSSYHNHLYDNVLNDWLTKEIEVYNRSAVTSRQNKLIGTGALQDKKKIEVLWRNNALNKNLAQTDWVSHRRK
jgi:DNA adenine methylase